MNHYAAYWIIRAVSGVGVWLGVLAISLAVSDATLSSALSGPVHFPSILIGAVLGVVWDLFVAASIAGWIVYGNAKDGWGGPPIYRPQPRPLFDD